MKTLRRILLIAVALVALAIEAMFWIASDWVNTATAPIVRVAVGFIPAPVRTRLAQWRQHAHQPTGPPRDRDSFAYC